ncbi:MAG: hypothetical protein HYU69_01520 [Bacteroidetes bacterium]|nr:hypothetical protein [Bacteroidota bacterium]
MLYPDELLPKPHYKGIDSDKLTPKSFLLRKSLNPPDPYNEEIRVDEIFDKGKELFGLSENLFGIYTLEHLKYVASKDKEKNYHSPWQVGDSVIKAEAVIFTIEENPAPIFFPVIAIHNVPFPIEKKISVQGNANPQTKKISGRIYVQHSPSKCNFWHFELRITEPDNNGEKEIKRNSTNTGDWRDEAAKSFLKFTLKIIGQRSVNDYDTPPTSLYIKD